MILVNPGDQPLAGSLQFFSQGSASASAEPVIMTTDQGSASSFNYSIPPHASFRLRTAGASADVKVGSARVIPAATNTAPVGVSIFAFRTAGSLSQKPEFLGRVRPPRSVSTQSLQVTFPDSRRGHIRQESPSPILLWRRLRLLLN